MWRIISLPMTMLVACGDDLPPSQGAPRVDATIVADAVAVGGDATLYCTDFPPPGAPLCPAAQPFCCPYSLETGNRCSSDPSPSAGITCREQPVGGLLTTCDAATGHGCAAPDAICCAEQLSTTAYTYCTDHAYRGPGWTCSP